MEIGSIKKALPLPPMNEARVLPPDPVRPVQVVASAREPERDKGAPQTAGSEARPLAEPKAAPNQSDVVRRQITVDHKTHKVVYEAVDTRTGEVVYQLPDARWLRAYAEQLKATDEEPARSNVQRLA